MILKKNRTRICFVNCNKISLWYDFDWLNSKNLNKITITERNKWHVEVFTQELWYGKFLSNKKRPMGREFLEGSVTYVYFHIQWCYDDWWAQFIKGYNKKKLTYVINKYFNCLILINTYPDIYIYLLRN